MKRKHKIYSRPKRPYDKIRIEEEGEIKKKFGLKNKREIWKAEARIKKIRERAKKIVTADDSVKQDMFKRLQKIGLNVSSIADILSLSKEDYLNRRLQTIVLKKGLVTTIKTARQMIVHKKVLVDGKAVNSPSYVVPVDLEDKIILKTSKNKKEEKKAEEKIGEEKNE